MNPVASKKKCKACRDGRHEDCDGFILRVEFGQHDQPCECICQYEGNSQPHLKEKRAVKTTEELKARNAEYQRKHRAKIKTTHKEE